MLVRHAGTGTGRRGAVTLAALGAGVLLLGVALFVAITTRGREPTLAGTDLGERAAPDFVLTDYQGQVVRLSDFRGKAVVLTFIYTNCPDVCPLTAGTLRATYDLLPTSMRTEVALLAITVDPERDTPEALRAFSATHGLDDNPNWFALGGDRIRLEPIWASYGVYPGPDWTTPGVDRMGHTDAIFLIDTNGKLRVLLRSEVTPQVLADNLEALLA